MGTDKKPLENLLKDLVGGLSGQGIPTQEDMAAIWEMVVGGKAAKHSKIRALKRGRLIVNIDDSSWLYELTVQKKEIINKLAAKLKNRKIKEITLRIGEIK